LAVSDLGYQAIASPPSAEGEGYAPGAGVSPESRVLPCVWLRGVRLHAVTEQQTIEHILRGLAEGRGGVVMTPNLDHMRRCIRDLSFSAMLDEAELVIADGMPLVWASRLQGTPLPQRVAGSDLILSLSGAASKQNRSVFLLGGLPHSAETAAGVLRGRFPELKVMGHHCPPVGFENDHAEMALIISKLAAARPDIVYVALGSPKQERVIAMLRRLLPGAWWLGVGMSFSFLAGDIRRAPRWMQRMGLEWVHRLGQEPRRLFKRYVLLGIPFAVALLMESVWRRTMGGAVRKPVVGLVTAGQRAAPSPPPLPYPGVPGEEVKAAATVPVVRFTHGEETNPARSLRRLKAVVLLAGSASPMTTAVGRSPLDMPVAEGLTLLEYWRQAARRAAEAIGLDRLGVRVILSADALAPAGSVAGSIGIGVQRDLSDVEGVASPLRKLAEEMEDDDLALLANAEQLPVVEIQEIAGRLAACGGEANIAGDGLLLMTGRALRLMPARCAADIRRQLTAELAKVVEVRVLSDDAMTLRVRTVEEYILGLRAARAKKGIDPLEEEDGSFSIVEAGGRVDEAARIFDSVILAGGRVEAGAIVSRSIVCAGGVVQHGEMVVDRIVVQVE